VDKCKTVPSVSRQIANNIHTCVYMHPNHLSRIPHPPHTTSRKDAKNYHRNRFGLRGHPHRTYSFCTAAKESTSCSNRPCYGSQVFREHLHSGAMYSKEGYSFLLRGRDPSQHPLRGNHNNHPNHRQPRIDDVSC